MAASVPAIPIIFIWLLARRSTCSRPSATGLHEATSMHDRSGAAEQVLPTLGSGQLPQLREIRLHTPASLIEQSATSHQVASSSRATHLQRAQLEAADANGEFHLAPVGENRCDYGVTATETACKAVGNKLLTDKRMTPGRNYLVADGWKTVPSGCSLKTREDWAVYYNTDVRGENDGKYSLICSGTDAAAHMAPKGEQECDFGDGLKIEKCLDGCRTVLDAQQKNLTHETLNVGSWSIKPPGCSMLIDIGGYLIAFFNMDLSASNDGLSTLVCSGDPVVMGNLF